MPINANRPVISYENAVLLKSSAKAYFDESNSGQNINFIPYVQDLNFDFSTETENVLSVGDTYYSKQISNKEPKVDLKIEVLENFGNLFSGFFSGNSIKENLDEDCNFYFSLGKNKMFSTFTDSDEFVSFGNCFLEKFSLTQESAGILSSSYNYSCSNVVAEIAVEEGDYLKIQNPAINLTGDQSQDLSSYFLNIQDYIDDEQGLGDKMILGSDSSIQISGDLSPDVLLLDLNLIQNFSLELNFERKEVYSIGKKYPVIRKAVFPSEGSFSVSSLLSNISGGNSNKSLKDFIFLNDTYNIKINLSNRQDEDFNFSISGAKIRSLRDSMSISNDLNSDVNFDFDIYNFIKI